MRTIYRTFLKTALSCKNCKFWPKFYILILMGFLAPSVCLAEGHLLCRLSAFYPSSAKFRKIYGHVQANYQLETTTSFPFSRMTGWANMDWVPATGHSKGFKKDTHADIVNLSIGIKVPFYIHHFTAYLGFAPSLGKIWIKNHSCCSHDHVKKYAIGGVVKSGLNYCIKHHLMLEAFVDYLYQPIHFDKTVDIGGRKAGVGLGIAF